VSERLKHLLSRFSSQTEMEQSMKDQGISSEEELRLRMAAMIEMEKYLSRQIQPLIAVTDDEMEDFFDKHHASLAWPEMLRVRHVFFAGLGKEADEVKKRAEDAFAQIQSNAKTFEQIAIDMSEDERSKSKGGDLGWITRERLAADFTEPVFATPLRLPTIFQSKLGWHLVEVTERREAKARTLDECRDEIRHALSDQKKPEALKNLRAAIRKSHQDHIHLYMPVIEDMP
jgi:parvulin-like peptidyl-prolyl isomerase